MRHQSNQLGERVDHFDARVDGRRVADRPRASRMPRMPTCRAPATSCARLSPTIAAVGRRHLHQVERRAEDAGCGFM